MGVKLYKATMPRNEIKYDSMTEWGNMPIGMQSAINHNIRDMKKQTRYIAVLGNQLVVASNPNLIQKLFAKRAGAINTGYSSAKMHTIEELEQLKKELLQSKEEEYQVLDAFAAPTNDKFSR